jgi:hypothetical protein
MDYADNNNRRKHPRARGDLSVSVARLDAAGAAARPGQRLDCHTKDLSFQGICLLCETELPPGSRLEIILSDNDRSRAFAFEGVVMWSNFDAEFHVYETGVQFQSKDEIPHGWKLLVINLLTESLSSSLAP